MQRKDINNIEVCQAVQEYQHDRGKSSCEILAEKFSCDEKLAYSVCERAEDDGLIDYGVSLRTGWLTEKGEQLLNSSKK